MEDEKVKQLAETLRKNGLAVSEYEAIEKAKSILSVQTQKSDVSQEENPTKQEMKNEQPMPNLDINITNQNKPLNELMKEVGVTSEQVEGQKQEKLDDIEAEVNEIKKDISQAESPEKTEQIKEEIADVKDDLDKIEEVKSEKEPQESSSQSGQDNSFKEEEKIDLTKIFNYKK